MENADFLVENDIILSWYNISYIPTFNFESRNLFSTIFLEKYIYVENGMESINGHNSI